MKERWIAEEMAEVVVSFKQVEQDKQRGKQVRMVHETNMTQLLI